MRILEHVVEEARTRGWDTLRNGELLDAAEAAGFELDEAAALLRRYLDEGGPAGFTGLPQEGLVWYRLGEALERRAQGCADAAAATNRPARSTPPSTASR